MNQGDFERVQDPGTPGKQVLKVTGGVTIGEARGFHEALVAALDAGSELQVDLSQMTAIDLTGLQLLCAAHQSALRGNKAFNISDGGNTIFRDMAADAGFQRHTGCARDTSFTCIWVGGES